MFLHHIIPQAILFSWGPIKIHYYGVIIALALIAAIFLVEYLAQKKAIKIVDIYSLAVYAAIFGIIGARLYEVFFINWPYYQNNLWAIFKIWQGGLAIHGAIIGGLLTLFFYSRINKIGFWRLIDLVTPALALAQSIGRWGNYFNQENFGRPTDLPWGIPIEARFRPREFVNQNYFHPAFLYESILDFILFLILFFLVKKTKRVGLVTGIYFTGYGVVRFFMEFIRVDATPMVLGLRLPQVVSVGVVAVGVLIIIFRKRPARII